MPATNGDDVKRVEAIFYERHVIFAAVAPRTQSPSQNQDKFELRKREVSVQNHSKITVRMSPSNCMWGFDQKGFLGGSRCFLQSKWGFEKNKTYFQLK